MRTHLRNPMTSIATAILLAVGGMGSAAAAEWDDMSPEARDAYRHGQIWATYAVNPALEASEIDVQVENDTVTLKGVVETPVEKLLAESIALGAQGVTQVDNQLKIDPELILVTTITPTRAYAQRVADATLAARVDSMLLWNEYTDGLDIDVGARDGMVTLTGKADTTGAMKRAGKIAANARGVVKVDNQLEVDTNLAAQASSQPVVTDDWIEDKIEDTYLYSMLVNSNTLDVESDESGNVTLSGTVRSPMAKQMAIELAQDTRGVDKVDASELVFLR